jgi:hypothetical protein
MKKKTYVAPWCEVISLKDETHLLSQSIHVTANKDSSNEQNWDNETTHAGTPHSNGAGRLDDSWFGTKDEVAP